MAEGGALLRRYTGLNPYRGFESLSLRQFSTPGKAVIEALALGQLAPQPDGMQEVARFGHRLAQLFDQNYRLLSQPAAAIAGRSEAAKERFHSRDIETPTLQGMQVFRTARD